MSCKDKCILQNPRYSYILSHELAVSHILHAGIDRCASTIYVVLEL